MAIESGQMSRDQRILSPVFFQSEAMGSDEIVRRVTARGKDRPNWVTGAGGETTARIIARMYRRGRTGPLWEYLIR